METEVKAEPKPEKKPRGWYLRAENRHLLVPKKEKKGKKAKAYKSKNLVKVIEKTMPMDERVSKAAELARGVLIQKTTKKGEAYIYETPPDLDAIEYLEAYVSGKPAIRSEISGADGAPIGVVLVPPQFMNKRKPRNDRDDGNSKE
jgi:hypothetical protein